MFPCKSDFSGSHSDASNHELPLRAATWLLLPSSWPNWKLIFVLYSEAASCQPWTVTRRQRIRFAPGSWTRWSCLGRKIESRRTCWVPLLFLCLQGTCMLDLWISTRSTKRGPRSSHRLGRWLWCSQTLSPGPDRLCFPNSLNSAQDWTKIRGHIHTPSLSWRIGRSKESRSAFLCCTRNEWTWKTLTKLYGTGALQSP